MIPEAFFVLLSICLLTNSKINYKNIAIASIIGGTGVYVARLMPIHFGVHTILGSVIYILLSYKFNNIKINKAIVGTLISIILLFISDILLIPLYKILNLPIELLMGKSLLSVLATLPSLILFYIMVRIIVSLKGKKYNNE
jgi:uncharacterized membrane protein YagU involved in acid resistance